MKNILLAILLAFTIYSCEDSDKGKLKDGWHKAYIEIMNADSGHETDSTAHVFLNKGTVTKICFESDRCIERFTLWEKYKDGQVIYGDDSLVYTVFFIPALLTPIEDFD